MAINPPLEQYPVVISVDSDGDGEVARMRVPMDPTVTVELDDDYSGLFTIAMDGDEAVLSATNVLEDGENWLLGFSATTDDEQSVWHAQFSVAGTGEGTLDPVFTFRSRLDYTDVAGLFQNTNLTNPVTAAGQRVGSVSDAGGGTMIAAADTNNYRPTYDEDGEQGVTAFTYPNANGDPSMLTWTVPDGVDLTDTTIGVLLRLSPDRQQCVPLSSVDESFVPLAIDGFNPGESALPMGVPVYIGGTEYSVLTRQQAYNLICTGGWKLLLLGKNADYSGAESFRIGNLSGGGYWAMDGDIAGMFLLTDANEDAITVETNWLLSRLADFNGLEATNLRYNFPSVANGYTFGFDFNFVGSATPDNLKAYLWSTSALTPITDEVTFAHDAETVVIPYDVSLEGTTPVTLRVYDGDNPTDFTDFPTTEVPYLYPVARTPEGKSLSIWGNQPRDIDNVSVEDLFTDRGILMAWRAKNGGDKPYLTAEYKQQNGLPNGELPPGYDSWATYLWEKTYIGYGRGGVYRVEWTMDNVEFSWGEMNGATAGTINNTEKWAECTVVENTEVFRGEMVFLKTGTVSDWNVTVVREDETSTGPINDQAVEMYTPGTKHRYMKQMEVEYPYPEYPTSPFIMAAPACTPEIIAATTQQTQTLPHICLPCNENDTYTTEFATELAAEFAARDLDGIQIDVELFNEPWNYQYSDGMIVLHNRAVDAGLVSGVPAGTYDIDWFVSIDGSNVLQETIPEGTYFTASMQPGGFWTLFYAENEVPSGTTLVKEPTGYTDGNFVVLADKDVFKQAMFDFIALRIGQIKDIFETAFDGANPIKSVYGIQLEAGEWASGPIAAQMMRGGAGTEYGKKIDIIEPSHYYGIYVAADWTNNPPDWVVDYENQEYFNTNCYIDSVRSIDFIIEVLIERLKYWGIMIDAGWDAADIPRLGTYEGGSHLTFFNVPEEHQIGLSDALLNFKYSEEYYDLQMYMLEELDDLGLESLINFALHGKTANYGNGTIQYFGWVSYVGAQNDPAQMALEHGYTALQDFYAARV